MKVITSKNLKEIINLYQNSNLSLRDLGKQYSCSYNTIKYHLKNNGVEIIKKRKKYKYYFKGIYMVALYDEEDNLVRLFDNHEQVALFLNKKPINVYRMLQEDKINCKIRYKDKWLYKVLIEINEENI